MDAFEFNKLAGAILGTALGVMALSIASEMIYQPIEPHTPGYIVALAKTAAATLASPNGPIVPIAARLQTASADSGETIAKKCLACHTLLKDQPAKVGPNLWGVVGGPAAHMPGFRYSDAVLQAHDKGTAWTYENLDQFLTAPKMFLPGTAMGFAGLPLAADRADVIAYLRTLSDSPPPLPAPPVVTASLTPAASPPPVTAAAVPAGHADAGAAIFLRCSACHRIGPDATNSVGPVLNGVVGRTAGTYPGYAYSDANRNSGVVWTEKALAQYLPAPTAFVPGTKMPFALGDPQEVADVIAYLEQYDAQGNKRTPTP
jgi:cytochrome c